MNISDEDKQALMLYDIEQEYKRALEDKDDIILITSNKKENSIALHNHGIHPVEFAYVIKQALDQNDELKLALMWILADNIKGKDNE